MDRPLMIEDDAGIRRVVLASGTVVLRKGIGGLGMIIGDKYKQNPFEKGTHFSCSAGSGQIAAKDFCGWELVFYFSTIVLKMGDCLGQETQKKLLNLRRNNTIILCWV